MRCLTNTLIGERDMMKSQALETSTSSVRSCFPELILDLESRIDEDIQFVQTTVIATIDTALTPHFTREL